MQTGSTKGMEICLGNFPNVSIDQDGTLGCRGTGRCWGDYSPARSIMLQPSLIPGIRGVIPLGFDDFLLILIGDRRFVASEMILLEFEQPVVVGRRILYIDLNDSKAISSSI
jgi:hypothetical protein